MLKAKDICAIVRACSEAGVHELKLGDFHVSFKADQKALEPTDAQTSYGQEFIPEKHSGSLTVVEEQLDFPFEEDERSLKEDRLANMMVEDPVGYEKLLASGDLDDGESA